MNLFVLKTLNPEKYSGLMEVSRFRFNHKPIIRSYQVFFKQTLTRQNILA